MREKSADQISGGVFLVGLAVLFMTGYWWPGLLFVASASVFAKAWAQGKPVSFGGIALLVIASMFAVPGIFGGLNIGVLIAMLLLFAGVSKISNGFGFNSNRLDDEEFDIFVRGKRRLSDDDEIYDDDYFYDDLDDPYYQEKHKNG